MAKSRTQRSTQSAAVTPVGEITGGVDTHLDFHVAAARDGLGRVLGTQRFPATQAGYGALVGWLRAFGPVAAVGVEGTGSYGAGLTTYLRGQGVEVVEVNRPNRQKRRLRGKSDPQDAINAAAAVQSGEATAAPKLRHGPVESVRVLRELRGQWTKARTAAINTLKSLLVTAPAALREQLHGLPTAALVDHCAALARLDLPQRRRGSRDRRQASTAVAADLLDSTRAVQLVLAELARTIQFYDQHLADLHAVQTELVTTIAPRTSALPGLGPDTTGQLLITAGNNPERLRSPAAFAALCGVAPLDASSGKQQHHRLSRAGDRQANAALYRIALCRLSNDKRTQQYVHTRLRPGTKMTKKHLIRCLKRYIARDIYPHLTTDLTNHPTPTT